MGVYLGAEGHAEDGQAGEGGGQYLDDAIAEDGAEHGGSKGEAGLQSCWEGVSSLVSMPCDGTRRAEAGILTEVHIGRVDEGSKNETDHDGAGRQGVSLGRDTF